MTLPAASPVAVYIVIVATFGAGVRLAMAQQPAAPDAKPAAKEPGVIRGRITAADNSRPLRRATVSGGDYLAVVRDFVADGEWESREFLEAARQDAVRVTLECGGAQSVALRLPSP